MGQVEMKQISKYLKGKKFVSIPMLQKQFGIKYSEARETMDILLGAGAVVFDSGIEYKIISDRLSRMPDGKRETEEDLEERKLREAREALERHKAEMLTRIQTEIDESSDDENEDEDDDDREEDIKNTLEFAGVDLDDLIKAIELGQKVTRAGNSFAVSVIMRGLVCSFSRAARLLDFMRDIGYVVRDPNNIRRLIVEVSDKELQKLKNLKDTD